MTEDDDAISMVEPKEKLRNLEALRSADPFTCEFGKFLAGYLNDELVPVGFVMGCELAIYDLKKGVNGYTGAPIQNKLVGQPPIVYRLLRMVIPTIADAVLPPEFAAKVKQEAAAT